MARVSGDDESYGGRTRELNRHTADILAKFNGRETAAVLARARAFNDRQQDYVTRLTEENNRRGAWIADYQQKVDRFEADHARAVAYAFRWESEQNAIRSSQGSASGAYGMLPGLQPYDLSNTAGLGAGLSDDGASPPISARPSPCPGPVLLSQCGSPIACAQYTPYAPPAPAVPTACASFDQYRTSAHAVPTLSPPGTFLGPSIFSAHHPSSQHGLPVPTMVRGESELGSSGLSS